MGPEERRAVATLAFIHGLVHGNVLAIPVFLAFAWRVEFGLDPVGAGALAAVAYVAFGASSVPFGRLADRGDPRVLLALCVAGIAASMAAVALSRTLPLLVGSLAALGIASGIYHPTGLAYISRHVREQGRGMGWHGMGGSLGVATGPAVVGALIALQVPWRYAAGAMAVPAILAFFLLASQRPPPSGAPRAPGGIGDALRGLGTRRFAAMLLVYMFAGVAYWGSLTFLPELVGAGSYAFLLALGAVGQVVSGHLADRPRPHRTLAAMSAIAAGVLATLATGIPAIVAAGAWVFGFLLFSLEPLQNTLVTAAVPPGDRGLAFGMTFLSVFGLGSIGAVLAGVLLATGRTAVLFLLLAASLVVSGLFALKSRESGRTAGRG
ncbi:MAG: MFS transporter [Methanobacteriota archaeon]|nr:MAG: MFS transporter [Euryarchaeota archaeon]